MTFPQLWSAIAPVWYSKKILVVCIIGVKTIKLLRETLRIYFGDISENLLYKYYYFYLS